VPSKLYPASHHLVSFLFPGLLGSHYSHCYFNNNTISNHPKQTPQQLVILELLQATKRPPSLILSPPSRIQKTSLYHSPKQKAMEAPLSPSSAQPRRPRGPKPNPYTTSSSGSSSSLRLSSLPRFHPANYNSSNSSMANTPSGSNLTSPTSSSLSPRRFFDPEQRQLSYYHQHLLAQSTMTNGVSGGNTKPASPKLAPLAGSPGPVTPLELDGESYLTAGGTGSKSPLSVDTIIAKESKRRGEMSPR